MKQLLVSTLHEVHVRPCDSDHCCLLTAGVGDAAAVGIEGQAVEGYSWAEVCQIVHSHSSAVHVAGFVEGNTIDRALENACHYNSDTVQEIVFLLVPACSHCSA